MARVDLKVAGSSYLLACADGDEERLKTLGKFVDSRAKDLRDKLGHVAETRLLLMTAIVIADELSEARGGDAGIAVSGYSDEDLAAMLDQVASDVEEVAGRLDAP